ncbi:ABC transporter ATP-binding protein [Infirmifilum lucidum]|uniref:ABC transporter ATP-binding protein n=1 Tax=Infirmifilum lucidum TaxID=2776706 RepID=A0A7L9FHN1_9CREN|nr:energy-coupling factor transporter ATPase [Infirmifilum lucidum]QOJ79227.1 ABC transporter ATP-binding protein [Infirmifilum lucidum]
MAAVEVRDLYWRYRGSREPALRGVTLDVREGEFLAITGPSGSGKTTLLMALTGIIPQRLPGEFSGRVRVLGRDASRTDVYDISREVGIVFEDPEIQFVMSTVEDEIVLGLEPLGLDESELRERLYWALNLVGLDETFLSRSPNQLSGGEKQRVAIASAIARKPKLLLLDEPTSDLDPVGKEEVVSAIRRLRDEFKATVVMVEHEPELIEEFADRLVVIDNGRVVLEGTPSEVYELGVRAKEHAAYPPDYFELAKQLRVSPPTLDQLLKVAREGMLNVQPLCDSVSPLGLERGVVASLRSVWFSYTRGKDVLRGVDLDLRAGELVALMGPNGSGKTTLSKVIAGLLKPSRGSVLIDGVEVSRYTRLELSSKVAYVYQNPQHQLFNQTVWEEVAFSWKIRGVPEEEYAEKVREALELFNLEGLEDEHPFFLSKGEKRRLAIASVYTLGPKILIVDEPTTGQDRRLSEHLMSIFKSLAKMGKTVLVVTHNVSLAFKYADRLVVMASGRIIADGHPRVVLSDDDVVREAHLKQPVEVLVCREAGVTPTRGYRHQRP